MDRWYFAVAVDKTERRGDSERGCGGAYICRRNWRSMTALLRNSYNCLNSSSSCREHFVGSRHDYY